MVHLGGCLGLKPGPLFTNFFLRADVFGQKRAENKVSGVDKKRRRAEQRRKVAAEARRLEAEGVTYAPGAF